MSFASDQLYNGYLRRNMPRIVSTVRVREIMVHLPCLTAHDRETIEAKREVCGNYDGMVLLLDCLKRRENWPEQFIAALEACEHRTLAAEIRAEYNSLRGINNPDPSPLPANVVRAHVHPAPSTSSQAAEPPAQPQAPQSPAAQVARAASPPEPVPEPPQSTESAAAPPPSTPPPSPAVHHPRATTPPAPQREINAQQEPEENSESDVQGVSENKVSVDSAATPEPSRPAEKRETDAPCQTASLQATSITEVRPPRSPSPTRINSDVTDGSSYRMPTPERPPIQDTMPPADKALADVLQPEETSEPPTRQVIGSRPQTETTASASALPGAAGINFSLPDDEISVCLSKPGHLVSIQPQNQASPTILAPNSPEAPYSGDSERLEFSESAPNTVISAHVPACSAVVPNAANTASALENGVAHDQNEPEENHYESPCQSLNTQDVQVNVVHVAEEPSILNLDGQISAPQVNGEAARAPSTITADSVSSLNSISGVNYHSSAPVPADTAPEQRTPLDSGENTAPHTPPSNTKYILTAAGVGACALLIAWRFKN